MSENWCRCSEGCRSDGPQMITKVNIEAYRPSESPYTLPAQNAIPTVLDYLAKAIEGLELAISELDHRIQPVSSQAVAIPADGYAITQDNPGSSDNAYRISGYAGTVNGLEARVQRMIRELEI